MFGLRNRGQLAQAIQDEFENLTATLSAFLDVAHNEDGSLRTADPSLAVISVGDIIMHGSSTVRSGFLLCDGSQKSRLTYNALFNEIGTTYGSGDGSTTFNVPDLRQRFPLGKAVSGTGSVLGSTGGAIDHTHTGGSHTHPFTTGAPSSTGTAATGGGVGIATNTHDHSGTTGASGAGVTGAENPPFTTLNFIIFAGV